MPIQLFATSPAPGYLVQVCTACGAEHTISLDRGAQKTKTGPFALQVGDTLNVRVDTQPPTAVVFSAGDFPDPSQVTAAELTARLGGAIPGARAVEDRGGVLLESLTTGEASRLEIVDGTACCALGFARDDLRDPCTTRPVLGTGADGAQLEPNVIALRRCNDCGANECLVRTFDTAPKHVEGTHFDGHRRAVNAFAEHCRAHGWSHPAAAGLHAAETDRPADIAHMRPDQPLALPPFKRPGAAAATVATGGEA